MANNTLAYGFVNLEHLMAERVTTVGATVISQAIQESASEYTRGVNALIASVVDRVTNYTERYKLPGTGTLQPLDENGNPLPVAEAGYYDVAYPIQGGGTAWGTNRVTRGLMTVEEANRQTVEALKRDSDWMRRHILAAIFTNTTWAYVDPLHGSLTIQPLALTADGVIYVRQGGAASTDQHYLAQAGAIGDATNPFPTIYEELMEHPSNSGPVVVYVPTANVAAVKTLTGFVPVGDPDINVGSATDTLNGAIDRGLGDTVLGKIDGCWAVEWRALPTDYLIGHAQGAGGFLGMREYPAQNLQGLFTENHSPDGNLQETRMIRYAGFGVRNRIAACVQRVGNGAYAIPTGYTAPLAV